MITQQELAAIFPDGVPIPVMKMIFPQKSEAMTVDDIRSILAAMRPIGPELIEAVETCVLFSTPGEYRGLADHAAFEAGQDNAVRTVVKLLRDIFGISASSNGVGKS